jgi:2-C-methyl-D-erythritol 4-phosphate cytidylyltransferase
VKAQLVIPAAGMGRRLDAPLPKALVRIVDAPLLVHTLRRFQTVNLTGPTLVLYPEGWRETFEAELAAHDLVERVELVVGGAERQDSVRIGIEALDAATEVVAVHDAARPFVSPVSVRHCLEEAYEYSAATVAIPAVDTILQVSEDGFLEHTPDRARMWACQTPQAFRVDAIRAAHEAAERAGHTATDDASLIRWHGGSVKIVMGTAHNIKVTTPADLTLAEMWLKDNVTCIE